MTIDEILDLLRATWQKNLSPIQELVLRQAWKGQTYTTMAQEFHYDANYLKNLAAELWHNLSDLFETPITKANFRPTLEDRQLTVQQRQSIGEYSSHRNPEFLLEFPSGPVPLDSPFYIERLPCEELAYQEIAKPGSLLRIKAPRMTGKTSLVIRLIDRAQQWDYKTVSINFQQADASFFDSLAQFLRWFCANISLQLQLPLQIDDYWDEEIGAKVSCTQYLQEYVLAALERPLILALNEIDRVFEYSKITREFLPLLRFWHEQGKQNAAFQKLRIVVVHSSEAYIPLKLDRSPFNVGFPLSLPSFNLAQVQELAQRHGLDWSEGSSAQDMLDLLGGHPYLVRLALYHLSSRGGTLSQLLQEASTLSGIYRDSLRQYWAILQSHPELAAALEQVVSADNGIELDARTSYQLESLGLVYLQGNRTFPNCQLFRTYFRTHFQHGNSLLDRLRQLEQENQELQRLSFIDDLTQLTNRRGFDEQLQHEWNRLAREGEPLALLLCDLDYFRYYNKSAGWLAGDRCLQKVAGAIRQAIHRPADLVSRYGSEEFAILLPYTDAAGAVFVAEKIRDRVKALRIERDFQIGFPADIVTLSVGAASQIPSPQTEASLLVRSAYEALEQAKRQGRDRVFLNSSRASSSESQESRE
jgi:diguanylate cyclase (GGDEF)-like protein